MTICTAWIRRQSSAQELVFVTDSRLRAYGSWDCNPKIFTFSRTDCAICFAGDTNFSYPMMIQLKNAIDSNPKIEKRFQRLGVFKGIIVKILDNMLQHKSDYEFPEVAFLFGGYCWFEQRFMLWKIYYLKNEKRFTAQKMLQTNDPYSQVAFIGDYVGDAIRRLKEKISGLDRDNNNGLNLEPLEVIRDMLTDETKDYRRIGGAPQMLKVYRSLNSVPFVVKWKIQEDEQLTFLGNTIKNFRALPYPVIDPMTLETSNVNSFR